MIKVALFDVYGTLLESPRHDAPYRHLLASMNLTLEEAQRAKRLLMAHELPTIQDAAELLEARLPGRRASAEARAEAARLLAAHLPSYAAIEGAWSTLKAAREAGLRLALISNLATPYKIPIRACGFERAVDAVVYSCEVGMIKPEPGIFELVLRRLGVAPEEAVMIGDNALDDVEGARGVGIRPMLIDPEHPEGLASIADVGRRLEAYVARNLAPRLP